ncbi:unnamed protein product, partial [Rotaria sp. Silwood1]
DLPGLDISPYVSVQIDNQKRYTSVQKSCNSPYFGEIPRNMTFALNNVTFSSLVNCVVNISDVD